MCLHWLGWQEISAHLCFHLHNHHSQMNRCWSLCLNQTPWLPHRISYFHCVCDAYAVFCPYGSSNGPFYGASLLLCTCCLLTLSLRCIPSQRGQLCNRYGTMCVWQDIIAHLLDDCLHSHSTFPWASSYSSLHLLHQWTSQTCLQFVTYFP